MGLPTLLSIFLSLFCRTMGYIDYSIDTLRLAVNAGTDFIDRSSKEISDALNTVDWSQATPANAFLPPKPLIWERVMEHLSQNKVGYSIGAGVLGFIGMITVYSRPSPATPRRKVPKLANGARRDVVLVVGSPTEPLTRLICLDFEKRGFIVYLTLLEANDVKYVETNPITQDMNYLNLHLLTLETLTNHLESQIDQFGKLLQQSVTPFAGASPHKLWLRLVVFSPLLHFAIGPVENISMSTWTKLHQRFLTYCMLLGCGLVQLVRKHGAKVIVLNPTIMSQLLMPYHAPETVFTNELRYLFTTLSRELRPVGILVTQVRVGNLHLSSQIKDSRLKISHIVNSEMLAWTQEMKELYGPQFAKSQYKLLPIKATGGKGTRLRDLYDKLFDLIYHKGMNPMVVYCGAGARSYDIITRIFPESWIGAFM